MKDRFRLDDWSAEWQVAIIADFPKLSRETRIFLMKAVALVYRANKYLDAQEDDVPGGRDDRALQEDVLA